MNANGATSGAAGRVIFVCTVDTGGGEIDFGGGGGSEECKEAEKKS